MEPVGVLTGARIRPIIIGVIVDYLSTAVSGTVYVILFSMKEGLKNGNSSEETIQRILTSPESLLILGLIGVFCTVLGGYIAGRVAKELEVKHGTLVGVGSLVLTTLEGIISGQSTPYPQWYGIMGYLVTIPAGALGGYIAQRQRELRAAHRLPGGTRVER
ncbi:MAG: YrzE family protein [Candidatus Binatia bacterium]